MKKLLLPILMTQLFLFGCAAGTSSTGAQDMPQAAGANDFNPWLRQKLPNTRQMTPEGEKMLNALGAKKQSIESEAAHRAKWREEIYPVVFGDPRAPHEIIVVLDFSNPESEKVWNAVAAASKNISPQTCKIVVYGQSRENYGTDLMGLAIWIAHSRKGQAMPYLTYALGRWNEIKAAQKKNGALKTFTNEYDATATAQDYPIHYGYLSRLKPPVPARQELAVAKYCYNAGSVNMYQATQICHYYGISSLPAVVVDGKVLKKVTPDAILTALK